MCMDKLMALTQQLQNISAISSKENGCTTHKLIYGTSISFDLLRNEDVDVFNSYLSKGAIFPWHDHPESDEVFVLYSGGLTIIYDDGKEVKRKSLEKGEPFVIRKGVKHLLKVNEEKTWLIAVIIPPDKTLK